MLHVLVQCDVTTLDAGALCTEVLHAYRDGVWKVQMFGMHVLVWSGMTCMGDMCMQRVGVHAYVWRIGGQMGVQQDGVCVHWHDTLAWQCGSV